MSNEVEALRKEFERFKKMATREIEAQAKAIRKLQEEVKDVAAERDKLTKYVNNLMQKADNVIKKNYASLRRTQVIDRQKMGDMEADLDRILRSNNKKQ